MAKGKQTKKTPGELDTFNGQIVWCENNFSIKLLSKQSKTRTEHQIFLILKQFQLLVMVRYHPSCPGFPALVPPPPHPQLPNPQGPFLMCTEHLVLSFGLLPLTQPSGSHPYLPRAAHESIFRGQKAVCPKRHPGTSCQDNNSFQPATRVESKIKRILSPEGGGDKVLEEFAFWEGDSTSCSNACLCQTPARCW